MPRTLSRLLPIAAVLTLSTCDSSSGPPEQPTVQFVFNVSRGSFAPDFDVVRTGGEFQVRGTFERPCGPGYAATATVVRQSNTLTLTVLGATVAGQECLPSADPQVRYDANIRPAAGISLLRIVHEGAGFPQPELVWEGNFQ